MPILISTAAAVVLAISLVIVSGRSAPPSQAESKDQSNLILMNIPVSEASKGSRQDLEGDTIIAKGKEFSNIEELNNILAEDRRGKSLQDEETAQPFNIIVPVARNFSSIKELFEILREDRAKPHIELTDGAIRNQTYVKGTENSDFELFFTS